MRAKARVFIGSSSEQVDTAYQIQRNLERTCDATVWDQGIFALTGNVLDDLIAVLDRSDFGIFVFGPDDLTTIRAKEYQTTRDNVVFELGLFIGKLGKSRTFFVMPKERNEFRLPSDLMGVTPAEFDHTREDRQAALGPACSKMSEKIKQLGIRPDRLNEPSVDRVQIKSVLCVSASRYENLGIEDDIKILESTFPGKVKSLRSAKSADLTETLLRERPDIVHVVVDIDPNTGTLIFEHGPTRGLRLPTEQHDALSVDGLASAVELAKPTLVILATCDALYTASKISRLTNVIAASGEIQVVVMVEWQRHFFGALAGGYSLFKSFELATAITKAAVVLHLKKDFVVTQ
jgi:hypothetical protein